MGTLVPTVRHFHTNLSESGPAPGQRMIDKADNIAKYTDV